MVEAHSEKHHHQTERSRADLDPGTERPDVEDRPDERQYDEHREDERPMRRSVTGRTAQQTLDFRCRPRVEGCVDEGLVDDERQQDECGLQPHLKARAART